MKQFFLSFILIISLIITNKLAAQTGIAINSDGSAADGSAMLDVKATNKGILIPRIASTAAVTTPVNGLLIYQTGGTPGFYYYNGSVWIYIQNSSVTDLNASNLTSGTVPVARLGTSGTASSTTFLRGDNSWATPAGGSIPAFSVVDASVASTFDCTNASVSNWIFDANGRNTSGVTMNIDLPAANAVPAGTIIRINFAANMTASPSIAIRSAGSFFNSFSQNDTNISASYGLVGQISLCAFLSDGSTKWYRVQ